MNELTSDALTAEAWEGFAQVLARCTPDQVRAMPGPLSNADLWVLMVLASMETTPQGVPTATWHLLQSQVHDEAQRRGWFPEGDDGAQGANDFVFEMIDQVPKLSDAQLSETIERTKGEPLPGVIASAWRMLHARAVQEAAARQPVR